MRKITLLLITLVSLSGFAQRTCGTEAHQAKLMLDPEYKRQYLESEALFEFEYQRLLQLEQDNLSRVIQSPNVTKVIPVAVHFPSVPNTSTASVKTCLRALAQSQINVINADYNAANTDISNWTAASAFYPGVTVGNLDLQFVISTQNHPAGTGLANGTVAVTFGTDFLAGADSDATWAGYMNFVVRDEGPTTLGYSPYPGTPSAGQTVVMNTTCFGKGAGCAGYVPEAPYNLGRTVTHELGHFFNLDHTFAGCGTTATCATSGDRVCDTPAVSVETYGCPANGSINGCVAGQKSLTMNYMDYVNDACMYMFTNGQKTRATARINVIYSQYLTNTLSNNDINSIAFSVFPNPSKGIVNIQFSNLVSDFSVEVYDMMGREVNFTKINDANNKSIVLDNVAKGVYYVNIESENSKTTKKIIIE
jgi:Secretion system C-terminal sorting domain/Pregnancy-associated plasma protein-A